MSTIFVLLSVLIRLTISKGSKYELITLDYDAEIGYAFPTDANREINRSNEFKFKTKQDNSFLFYIGSLPDFGEHFKITNTQFISIYIEDGLFNIMISNPEAAHPSFYTRKFQCNSYYNTCADDNWHSVELKQLKNEIIITLDENKIEFKNVPQEKYIKTVHLKIAKPTEPFEIYRRTHLRQIAALKQFRGCMKDIYMIQNNVKLNIIEMVSKNVYNFHSNGKIQLDKCIDLFPTHPVTFNANGDHLSTSGIKSITNGKLILILKSLKANCLIAYQSSENNDNRPDVNFYAIEIRNSYLYFSIGFNSELYSKYIPNVNVSNGLEHTIELIFQSENVIIIVDSVKFILNTSRGISNVNLSGLLYIGGVNESKRFSLPHQIWFGLLAKFFSGCIISLTIDDRPIHLDLLVDRNSSIRIGCKTVDEIYGSNECANQPCNEGQCMMEWDQRVCDCSRTNFTGETCYKEAIVAEFNGYQFMRIKFPFSMNSEVENLNLQFKSKSPNGLILSTQNQYSGATDKLQIFMMNGTIHILYNFGQGNKKFKTNDTCFDGKWHLLRMERRKNQLSVWIDEKKYYFNDFREIDSPVVRIKYLIIGSAIDNEADITSPISIFSSDLIRLGKTSNGKNQYFIGHMMHFIYNGQDYFQLAKKSSPVNIEVTASLRRNDFIKQFAINFHSVKSYLVIPKINIFGDFRLEFQMKTLRSSGLLLFLHGESNDYLILEMVNGLLHIIYNWGSGYKRKISESGLLNDGMWHSVKIVRHMSKTHSFAFRVDGIPEDSRADIPVNKGGLNFNHFGLMHLGGYMENKSIITFDSETTRSQGGFQGCIASFYVNNSISSDHHVTYRDLLQEASEIKNVEENCPDVKPDKKGYCYPDSCSFGGRCIQNWAKYTCDCSLTSFSGPKCEFVSTTVHFVKHPSYIVFKYSVSKKHIINQLAFGFQTNTLKATSLISIVGSSRMSYFINIDIKIINDYGFIQVDYNTDSGSHSFVETRLNVIDGLYHIVRFTREGNTATLKVDNLSERIHVPDGVQLFLPIEEELLIIVGSNSINSKNSFQGYMSGLSMNQILFLDILKDKVDPNIHLINKSNIFIIQNFIPRRSDQSSVFLKQSEEEIKSPDNNQKTSRLVVARPHCPGITEDEKVQCQQLTHKGLIKPGIMYRKTNDNDNNNEKASSQESQLVTTNNPIDSQSINNQATSETNNFFKTNSINHNESKDGLNINIWLIAAFSCGGAFMLIALSCLIYRCSTKDEGSYNVKEDRISIQTNANSSKLKAKINGDEKSNQSLLSNAPSKRKSKRKRSGETKEWYV